MPAVAVPASAPLRAATALASLVKCGDNSNLSGPARQACCPVRGSGLDGGGAYAGLGYYSIPANPPPGVIIWVHHRSRWCG